MSYFHTVIVHCSAGKSVLKIFCGCLLKDGNSSYRYVRNHNDVLVFAVFECIYEPVFLFVIKPAKIRIGFVFI